MFGQLGRSKLFRVLLVILAVVGVPLLVNSVSPVPGATVARFFIGLHGGAKPPADYNAIEQDVTVVKDVTVAVKDAPEARLDIYTPKHGEGTHPIILWIHGGGFVGSSKADTSVYSTLLAHEGYTVASLEFTRPPESRYPVPVRQANAALRYLSRNAAMYRGDAARLFVAGNSSGSQIASQTVAVETDPRLSSAMHLEPALQPGTLRGAVLYCGAYDMVTLKKAHFPFLRTGLWAYTGHRDWTTFPDIDQLSTIHHLTPQYPPVFLAAGDIDPLEPQSLEFAAELRKHNLPVTTQFWDGSGRKLDHDYQFDLKRPEAQETYRNMLQFLTTRSEEVTTQ